MTVREAYAKAVGELARAGVESPQAEAWQLIEAATGRGRVDLHFADPVLDGDERRRLGEWLARRSLREPLQLILGRAYFYGLELAVSPGVLIPRPETERLVEIALTGLAGLDTPLVVDIGTGTGAVALAIASERRDARVAASDISPAALRLARENAERLGLEIELFHSDLLSEPELAERVRAADLLVSNPPYLPTDDRRSLQAEVAWDPAEALFAGSDGLDVFRSLLEAAAVNLARGGCMLVELDPRNVHRAAQHAGAFAEVEVLEDLAGRPRFLRLIR